MKRLHKGQDQSPKNKIEKVIKIKTLSKRKNSEKPSNLIAIKSDHSRLDSVVVVRESSVARVSDGGELGVCEADGAVGEVERDVCDGDLGIS